VGCNYISEIARVTAVAVHAMKEEEKGLGLGGLLNVCKVEVESVVGESGMGGVLFEIKYGLLPLDLFVL
jgi:hypothetical protein